MDADLGMANVDILLGLRPEFDLYDVVKGEKTLDEVIVDGPMGIKVVPASSGVGRMAELSVMEQANLIRAFGEIGSNVDFLIVDTAAGISTSVVSFAKAAQEIMVVVCDEPASLTDAYALIKVLSLEHGVKRFQVLANMVRDAEHGRKLFAKLVRTTEAFLDVSIGFLGSIPFDEKLVDAVRQQAAVMEAFPHSASSIAFQGLAKNIDALPAVPTTTGFLEFFVERTIPDEPMRAGSFL
jgi:flagellar biosynthesis protein FlhG